MADENERLVAQLQLQDHQNQECADCRTRHNVEWASYNIGIFLCTRCAAVHRSIGVQISKVKHTKLDKWEDSQQERMKAVGNKAAREQYESRVPLCYLRPNEFSNQYVVFILFSSCTMMLFHNTQLATAMITHHRQHCAHILNRVCSRRPLSLAES